MGPGLNAERTPVEWFEEAARCYVEGHQACAWCGQTHSVFKHEWGQHVEYHCSACDSSACLDRLSGRYFAKPGGTPHAPAAPHATRLVQRAG
jgi:hypothetical protein